MAEAAGIQPDPTDAALAAEIEAVARIVARRALRILEEQQREVEQQKNRPELAGGDEDRRSD